MKENKDSQQCYICGKDFRVVRTPGDVTEAPELKITTEGKEEWICPNCRERIKGKSIIIQKQESYYDRNIRDVLDMIGLTFLIREKPNFYLDVVISKSKATFYKNNFKEDPFRFLRRRGSEVFLEKIEKEDYTSEMIDLSYEIKYKTQYL